MNDRKIYIIGENHTKPILTFTKIQKIKLKNPDEKFLFFGEYGMKDNYKKFDESIEVIEGSQIISDISMIIYAYLGLVTWDEDKYGYPIVMEALIKKNIFTKTEYILPNSSSNWISQSKIILRKKISDILNELSIPDKIIKNIIDYLEKDEWQDALNIMQKIVNFSIFRKTLEYSDLDSNFSFIIIVGSNHVEHLKTIFTNSEQLGGSNIKITYSNHYDVNSNYKSKYYKYKMKYLNLKD